MFLNCSYVPNDGIAYAPVTAEPTIWAIAVQCVAAQRRRATALPSKKPTNSEPRGASFAMLLRMLSGMPGFRPFSIASPTRPAAPRTASETSFLRSAFGWEEDIGHFIDLRTVDAKRAAALRPRAFSPARARSAWDRDRRCMPLRDAGPRWSGGAPPDPRW
jgi:hypothetical protein